MFWIMLSPHSWMANHTPYNSKPVHNLCVWGVFLDMHGPEVPCYNIFSKGGARRDSCYHTRTPKYRDMPDNDKDIYRPFPPL